MYPYIPNTQDDERELLSNIGIDSIENLFEDIPESIKLNRRLNLNRPMSEIEVKNHIENLARKNKSTDELICFLGAGAYDHYIPSVIKHITSRAEFYTAYTPYQPEISQGTLQVIFEYQSMICSLTGMDVSNASMYDGATATAEAAFMACDNTRRNSIVVSKTVHPEIRRTLKTYLYFRGIEYVEVEDNDGVTDIEKLKAVVSNKTAGVIVQSPNFFGIIEDVTEIEKCVHENKGMLIMNVDPVSLALLKSPAEQGADIAVGEGQGLGSSLNYGGPYLGFMATTSKLMRKLPGRIVGQTEDVDGKRAFVLTLQAREQHIRRQKATSNICSNQAINALTAAIYLTTMGKKGLREVAVQSTQKAHYALNKLNNTGIYKPLFNKPFFKEFAVKCNSEIEKINQELLKNNIIGGYDLGKDYPDYTNSMLLCVTEKRTKNEIDTLVALMEGIR
ncbi:glycine dehydrogenase subunit 1 [Fervidicella metallireducens AeB]|uniref:Probable glycine dehydrogenase (decarboxylating) subunit 1 n=1 Tax=Fervidicella metallireducens AeB TaxID=1403537 RepID=A0A017RXT3_9CLOT|nr:aminomethyl-transferring glycine dehydrogenase subunit GcvPA [Fervidicella metallireducens]EYE88755.1 glycine dehydrogenase subunit 1 [Fervidicella metallireducens AeB]